MVLLLLFFELAIIYLVSQALIQTIFSFLLQIFRSRSIAVSLTALLLFPGTVVHELSHLFTAEILGVKTGKLNLAPEDIRGPDIKTGSVAIAQSGPFRRALIGIAPLAWGIIVLTALSWFLSAVWQETLTNTSQGGVNAFLSFCKLFTVFYLLFSVSNSMFSSKEDLKGFWPAAIAVAILVCVLYFTGLNVQPPQTALEIFNRSLTALVQSLGVILAINFVLLLIIKFLIAAAGKSQKHPA